MLTVVFPTRTTYLFLVSKKRRSSEAKLVNCYLMLSLNSREADDVTLSACKDLCRSASSDLAVQMDRSSVEHAIAATGSAIAPSPTHNYVREKQSFVEWLCLRAITVRRDDTYVPKTRPNEVGSCKIKDLYEIARDYF